MTELVSAPDISTAGGIAGTSLIPITTAAGAELYQTTAAELAAFTGGGGTPWDFMPPVAAYFTLVNGVGHDLVLADDADVGLTYDGGAPAGGDLGAFAVKTLPTPATDWTLICKMDGWLAAANYSGYGPVLLNSGNNRLLDFFTTNNNNTSLVKLLRMGLTSGFNNEDDVAFMGTFSWFKIAKVGTTLSFYASTNGKIWSLLLTQDTSTWLSDYPDKVGFGVDYNRSSGPAITGRVSYWSLTGGGL